jgi:deoxyribodipyrimidine photo-lyase
VQKILVLNNLAALKNFDLEITEVLYAPLFFSALQRSFFRDRFDGLKRIAPHLKWCQQIEEDGFDSVLALSALNERRAFKEKLLPAQNRLFTTLPFDLPKTFTPFKKLIEKELPASFSDAHEPWDPEVVGELAYYFEEKKLPLTYLDTRNEMTGRDGSTKFSRHLSCGALDVKCLYNHVRNFEGAHGATKSTEALIYELLWREYFYWHYQAHPREYFSKNGIKGELDFSAFTVPRFSELRDLSPNPFFHAALNELEETGFLGNRTRQIFASVWINDLALDWRSGAQLFEENLIDYDVFSNNGNWMYLAGVGVDPRGKRYFNVEKQLETYDPEGTYLKRWS